MFEKEKPPFASNPASAILANLDNLLDRERSALLSGDLDGISRSLQEKERLIGALKNTGLLEGVSLGAISEKVRRNQVLLDGALNGIRAVADRLSALRRIRDTLETYDQSGQKTLIDGLPTSRFEKRA